jgi:hypothetical protein
LALTDGENIKWPELNAHSDSSAGEDHALPVTQGVRTRGFVSGDDAPSTYPPSTAGFHAAQDNPYTVPPLPHMNPGLGGLYRDGPNAQQGAIHTAGPCRRRSTRACTAHCRRMERGGDRDDAEDGQGEPEPGPGGDVHWRWADGESGAGDVR